MKIKLLSILFLFNIFSVVSQTNGWYLYTKPSKVNKILPDDTNPEELHIATDIGWIKKNTLTNATLDFVNLTSQNPAIDAVEDIALDPTSNDIAFALKNAIAIYDGSNIALYTYDDSGLTIGESTSQFINLQVEYAKDGSLYIFKEDAFGYQTFNNGTFNAEVTTSFKPQDVVENNGGTKAYFAGSNNGLWELEKATTTWVNFTSDNSSLTNNFLTSFAVDSNDNLYIGHYQGLDKLEPNGTFSNCNATSPMAVFEISVSPINNELLVRNSLPHSSYNGLSIVDYNSCTWTNYKEDGTNCLDENVYSACSYGKNGLAYVAPYVFSPISDIGNVIEFTTTTENCSAFDINYLNAPVAINSNVATSSSIRILPNGNLELGVTRTKDLHTVEIDPLSFNGTFPAPTTLTPDPGNNVISLLSDNEDYIVETNTGWLFIDENNVVIPFSHNLPSYLAINSIKASAYDSESGNFTIIHKGFDSSFNYRVYKTKCSTLTGFCLPSEEIFTNDRDLSQNIIFGASEDKTTNDIAVVAVKTNGSGQIARTKEQWNGTLNDAPQIVWDENHLLYTLFEPLLLFTQFETVPKAIAFVPDENTLQVRIEDPDTGDPVITNTTFDNNSDGTPDKIVRTGSTVISDADASSIADYLVFAFGGAKSRSFQTSINHIFVANDGINDEKIINSQLSNNLPNDISINNVEVKQYSSTEVLITLLTNYGLLVKTAIDISNLTLHTNDVSLNTKNITLYPNPTNKAFYINQTHPIDSITIFDVNGKLIKSFDHEQTAYNIEDLSEGVYFVKVASKGKWAVKKLIIAQD